MLFLISVSISSINALTLSPALCSLLLRKSPTERGGFFGWFNRSFERFTGGYGWCVKGLVRHLGLVSIGFLLLLGSTGYEATKLPTGFLPIEDKGSFVLDLTLPDAAALPRTKTVLAHITEIIKQEPGVKEVIGVAGYSLQRRTIKQCRPWFHYS